jgi:hypothetical protein
MAVIQPHDLSDAIALEKAGHMEEALISYRTIGADSTDETSARRACLGAARCLIAMGNYPAALAVLEPMPTEPTTDWDRRRLALGAEAMARLGVWAHAESLAEVALSDLGLDDEQPLWVAVCSANLARAYLENDKPMKADRMYRAACARFEKTGQPGPASECMALALEIEGLIGTPDEEAPSQTGSSDSAQPAPHSRTRAE